MRRDLEALVRPTYDLLIVGGGIFGIFAAWDAARRGLSVAIVERSDWAHAASANCFKIVHGGIRYLQHGDLVRVRQSNRERNILLRVAPHLVRPLPILIPTYGHGRSGKGLLAAGLKLYEAATWDRNRGIQDPGRRLPPSRLLSRSATLELYPDLPGDGLTGGAIFHDAQMYSPARLALAVLRSAADAGAEAANYVEATRFLREGDRVVGIAAKDRETGAELLIRSRFVLNAAGAWAEPLLLAGGVPTPATRSTFSRDAFFVLPRRVGPDIALAVKGRTRDPDAILSREARHLFLVPWRNCTLVGVWHVVYDGRPDDVTLPEHDLREFIEEINWAYPGVRARLDEISMAHHGLVLFGENAPGSRNLSYGKRSRVIDHARESGIGGLVTLIGVRYTTARHEAQLVVDLIGERIRPGAPACTTIWAPIHGGAIANMSSYLDQARREVPRGVSDRTLAGLVQSHGSAYREVLAMADEGPDRSTRLDDSLVQEAEVRYAVRMEMARRLADIWFRRTDAGNGVPPRDETLARTSAIMARELRWDETRQAREIEEVRSAFRQSGQGVL